jgi:hypothetical protein
VLVLVLGLVLGLVLLVLLVVQLLVWWIVVGARSWGDAGLLRAAAHGGRGRGAGGGLVLLGHLLGHVLGHLLGRGLPVLGRRGHHVLLLGHLLGRRGHHVLLLGHLRGLPVLRRRGHHAAPPALTGLLRLRSRLMGLGVRRRGTAVRYGRELRLVLGHLLGPGLPVLGRRGHHAAPPALTGSLRGRRGLLGGGVRGRGAAVRRGRELRLVLVLVLGLVLGLVLLLRRGSSHHATAGGGMATLRRRYSEGRRLGAAALLLLLLTGRRHTHAHTYTHTYALALTTLTLALAEPHHRGRRGHAAARRVVRVRVAPS